MAVRWQMTSGGFHENTAGAAGGAILLAKSAPLPATMRTFTNATLPLSHAALRVDGVKFHRNRMAAGAFSKPTTLYDHTMVI